MSKLVGYFVSAGDPIVSDMFTQYLWGDVGFATKLEKIISKRKFGTLELLLIKYQVEGQFTRWMPETFKVSNYSSKNRDIAVDVPVRREDFHDRSDQERRQFIVSSTEKAVLLVHERMLKKGLAFNLSAILSDIRMAAGIYLGNPN